MPIPKPHASEKEQEFISRFMADPAMVAEYPDKEIALPLPILLGGRRN